MRGLLKAASIPRWALANVANCSSGKGLAGRRAKLAVLRRCPEPLGRTEYPRPITANWLPRGAIKHRGWRPSMRSAR